MTVDSVQFFSGVSVAHSSSYVCPVAYDVDCRMASESRLGVEGLCVYTNRYAFVLLGVLTSDFASRSVRRGNNKDRTKNR